MFSNALQSGDIVVMGTQTALGVFTGTHTLMALGGDRYAESIPAGVVVTTAFNPMDVADGEAAKAFRLNGTAGGGVLAGSASEAAYFAEAWAMPAVVGGERTAYGLGRASGIKQYQIAAAAAAGVAIGLAPPPPFSFDALFRALKWTTRGAEGRVFSRNKGITCCAFVTASYQAGMILRLAQWDVAKVKAGFTRIEALRVNKKDPANYDARHVMERYQNRDVPGYYKIGKSNVGMIAPAPGAAAPTLPELIRELLTGFENFKLRTLLARAGNLTADDLFTPALAVDAKFFHSGQLYRQLVGDAAWTALGSVENNP